MKTKILLSAFVLALCFSQVQGQEGYLGSSSFRPNSDKANELFRFDHLMTASLNAPGFGSKTLLMYLNSADGSWAVDENSALAAGFAPVRGSRKFMFAIGYSNGNRRTYTVGKDDPSDREYYGSTPGETSPLLRMRDRGRIDFKEFIRSAVTLETDPHPVYGSQKLYEGKIMGETVRMKITDDPVNISINTELLGMFCGIFKDHFREQNRIITYFKGPAFSMELTEILKGPSQFDGRGYEGMDMESTFDPEAMKDIGVEELKEFQVQMAEINEAIKKIYEAHPCRTGTDASLAACRRHRDRLVEEQNKRKEELMKTMPGIPPRLFEESVSSDCFVCEIGSGHQLERIRGCVMGEDGKLQIVTSWPKDPSNPEKDVIEIIDFMQDYMADLIAEGYTCEY